MNNKKITTMFMLIATITLLGIVGFTIAYFTSSTDFENEFQTGLYQTEATETFVSPTNWLPGDTTPKTLTITNTGNVDVKARVCLTEEWTSHNDDPLPLEQNGNRAAIINLDNQTDWTYRLGCYEYNDVLEPNDETSSFMSSVTFNPSIESDIECTTTTNNGVTTKTCESTGDGYDNATYTLTLRVETVQASAYEELWPTIRFVDRQNNNQITEGDEISIDLEHFYVVSSNQNETVLLSKYNLLVGDVFDYDATNYTYTLKKTLSSSDEGYGLQNSNARGDIPLESGETTTQYIGTVGFSGTNYWDNSVCQRTGTSWSCTGTSGLLSEYANEANVAGATPYTSPYPYVYRSNIGNTIAPNIVYDPTYGSGYLQNNGYTIAYYVESYINTLKSLGAPNTISGRLLSQEEASMIKNGNSNSLKDHIFDSSYWLGTASSSSTIWCVNSNQSLGLNSVVGSDLKGVRPVIVVSTSDL